MNLAPIPTLHVMPAHTPHDEVIIVGDRAALEMLRDAIAGALERGSAGTGTLYAGDGEGYHIVAVQSDTTSISNDVPLPYADPIDRSPWPEWLIRHAMRARQQALPVGMPFRGS